MNPDAHPITVQPPPFFRDHHVDGRPVFPAVEAMERLAADTHARFPHLDGRRLSDLRFAKFLRLDDGSAVAAFNRTASNGDGSVRAALATRFTAPTGSMTRILEHAALTMGSAAPADTAPTLESAAALSGVCTVALPGRIYTEMVPFGAAYRNIRGDLLLSADGALAPVGSPQPPDPRTDLFLGSPYVLDAAFHAACVWCQRFCNRVAFPVSVARRTVFSPTRLDEVYTARVVPVQTAAEPFVFDIFIYDAQGEIREAAVGVGMRDVSGGRARPPAGFHQPAGADPLADLSRTVSGMILIERTALAPFAPAALSPGESRRMTGMTTQRTGGYLSARLALKRLSRMLSGDDRRPAADIDTVAPDGRRPQCPLADGRRLFCAVAHDRRFTVAVAADRVVGVDVEPLSSKALRAAPLYMHPEERALADRSPLDAAACALRVWSAKEAAAKLLDIDLADAWSRVRATEVAEAHTRLAVEGGRPVTARHVVCEAHLFTLLAPEMQQ